MQQLRFNPKVAGQSRPQIYRCAACQRDFTSRYARKVHLCEQSRASARPEAN
jgi:ribosomal protein L37AE/L43A